MTTQTEVNHTQMDQQISALITEWQARKFQWGVTDCSQFARAAAWQLHGIAVDVPSYVSERHALRTLQAQGGYAGFFKLAGLSQRPVANARRGDFVVFRHEGAGLFAEGLAVVTGTHAHATTRLGLVALDRSVWLQCWGVD